MGDHSGGLERKGFFFLGEKASAAAAAAAAALLLRGSFLPRQIGATVIIGNF